MIACCRSGERSSRTRFQRPDATASPEGMRGRYLAAFQFSWSIAGILTPGLFTLLYAAGPMLPWIAVGGMALAASAGLLPLESRLPPHAVRRAAP